MDRPEAKEPQDQTLISRDLFDLFESEETVAQDRNETELQEMECDITPEQATNLVADIESAVLSG